MHARTTNVRCHLLSVGACKPPHVDRSVRRDHMHLGGATRGGLSLLPLHVLDMQGHLRVRLFTIAHLAHVA